MDDFASVEWQLAIKIIQQAGDTVRLWCLSWSEGVHWRSHGEKVPAGEINCHYRIICCNLMVSSEYCSTHCVVLAQGKTSICPKQRLCPKNGNVTQQLRACKVLVSFSCRALLYYSAAGQQSLRYFLGSIGKVFVIFVQQPQNTPTFYKKYLPPPPRYYQSCRWLTVCRCAIWSNRSAF